MVEDAWTSSVCPCDHSSAFDIQGEYEWIAATTIVCSAAAIFGIVGAGACWYK